LRGKTFKRKVDADAYRAQVEVDKRTGTYADPALGKTPLAEWAQRWQATTVHLRPSTRARDKLLLERFILPRFGRRQLSAIGQLDVRTWVADLSAQGLAPATVAKCYQVLGKVMAAAVDAGLIARSPCRAIRLPRVERDPPRFLTPAEVARLADAIDPRYRALVLVAAYGGLRIGELAGLTRRRVDPPSWDRGGSRDRHRGRGPPRWWSPQDARRPPHRGPAPPRRCRVGAASGRLHRPGATASVFPAPLGAPLRVTAFRNRV
jgi:integrase